MCIWLNKKYGFDYDYKDIKAKFTPKIPHNDLVVANILSQLGDKLSTETGLSQPSFIDNPHAEGAKSDVRELYWLSHTKAPAILIEVCFVDSKADTDY